MDIEGSDHLCVRALTSDTRPAFLSFEAGPDADALVQHAMSIGYTKFKIINQVTFRELTRQNCLRDRIAERIMRELGYDEPRQYRHAGRWFTSGHSSGPLPWQTGGQWTDGETTRERWRNADIACWYDIHATT